jgi:hypothetical protein
MTRAILAVHLAPEVRIVAILGDVTLEFVSKVLTLSDCDLSGDPKSSTKAGIA